MLTRPARIRERFGSLWNSHTSPRKLAIALAVGVFLGATPLWGLHTLLAVAACFLLGLNKPATLCGTLVSNPVMTPILIFFSLETGSWVLYGRAAHLSLQEIRRLFHPLHGQELFNEYILPYSVGSLIVGLVLAFVTFWVALWIARSYRNAHQ